VDRRDARFAGRYVHRDPRLLDIVRAQNRAWRSGCSTNPLLSGDTCCAGFLAAEGVVSAVIWKARRLDPLYLLGFALILGGAGGI